VITNLAHIECELVLYVEAGSIVLVTMELPGEGLSLDDHSDVGQALQAPGELPARAEGVIRIDFHVHTNRSPEGIHSLGDVIEHAKKVGLDGIAVTDHNCLLSREAAAKISKVHGFVVIGGVEAGDLIRKSRDHYAHRHWIGLNVDQVPESEGVREAIDAIREQGGLSIAAHPYARNGFREYDRLRFDAVETLNGTRKDPVIDGRGLATVGGTDAHAKYMLGHTWTDVYGSNGSVESILENVRKGNCAPGGSRIPLWVIARFYVAVLGRYLCREPCELLQSGSRQLRKYC
jgi:predicted metal-dependent phosphoesterase TrpH